MTERERWTVYPLLLLSLAISLRSKVTQSLDLNEISCSTLRCNRIVGKEVDTACQTLICDHIVGADAGFHRGKVQLFEIVGTDGKPRLILSAEDAKAGSGGALAVLAADGNPEVLLRALPTGGLIEIVAPGDKKVTHVRTLEVGGDRVGQIRQAEAKPGEKSGQPAATPDDKPKDDGSEKSQKPADQPATEKQPVAPPADDKPSPGGDEKGADDKPGEAPTER